MFHIEHSYKVVDCMLNNPPSPPPPSNSDLADTMHLAEFGPSLASHEARSCEKEEAAVDGEKTSVHSNSAVEAKGKNKNKNKRRRDKVSKSIEEVERQRMTHIAVERNRRKQMNEHLQILRSLMPPYYVHRGDQASIVGAAIEFVRELQQLLQCLESVKRHHHQPQMILPPTLDHQVQAVGYEAGVDQTAVSKSYSADVEVRLSGLFGLIKILSRRRRGLLIKNIAAVEHLQLHILQTDITTIQQDVVCSFTVKMSREAMVTAEDMANSIQQILNSLHASSSMS